MTAKSVRLVWALVLGWAAAPGALAQDTGKTKDTAGTQKGKAAPKAPESGNVAPKDQAIDDLLGKLGESKDEPAPEERPRNPGGGAGERPKEQTPPAKGKAADLGGKDKEIDDRLEEIAGRKRKRPAVIKTSAAARSAR